MWYTKWNTVYQTEKRGAQRRETGGGGGVLEVTENNAHEILSV